MAEQYPSLAGGYFDFRRMAEEDQQTQIRTQLLQQQQQQQAAALEAAQANLPLQNLQRQVQMGEASGQLSRQPDVLATEAARAEAARIRMPLEIQGADLEANNKVRSARMKATADEMEMYLGIVDPILRATEAGNYTAANKAWDSAFDALEKAGIPNIDQLRVTPRDQLLPRFKQKYTEALNNAPAIRARLLQDETQKRELERIKARGEAAARVARIRIEATADKPPATENALIARLKYQYGKNPSSLTEEQAGILRAALEDSPERYTPEASGRAFDAAGARVKAEVKAGTLQDRPDVKTAKTLEYYKEEVKKMVRKNYSKLYPEGTQTVDELPAEARSKLEEGKPTTFRNGQTWTLQGGQPVRLR